MTISTNIDISFTDFAAECYKEHPEIINHWKTCIDPFKRAMAKMILDVAGGVVNES